MIKSQRNAPPRSISQDNEESKEPSNSAKSAKKFLEKYAWADELL